MHVKFVALLALSFLAAGGPWVRAQPALPEGGGGRFGGGRGGPPGGVREEVVLVDRFDRDGDGRLNAPERKEARQFLVREAAEGRGPRRPGPRGGGRGFSGPPPEAGRRIGLGDVDRYPDAGPFETGRLRTIFLEFENAGWEQELADFYGTDVEVPARVKIDGKEYPEVGVHFRGASSFFTVGAGYKRSLNLSFDFARRDQRWQGLRTLNLLNSHTDPSMLRTMLYGHVAREYLPAPRATHVRVVINGECWGVYVAAEQFNADFVRANFGTTKGARWKVPGSPRGRGGLTYLGEDEAPYRVIYELKTKDQPKVWRDLIGLCRVLNQTPPDRLEEALQPVLDVEGALRFLALENVFINGDGYWTRASDYCLYQDPTGRFHLVPHDANETFRPPSGPGFGGGPRVSGVDLDPLAGAEDVDKPLLQRLLAVPALRARYYGHVRSMTTTWLDWERIGPLAAKWQAVIADDVRQDTRKLASFEAFEASTRRSPAEGEVSDRRSGGSLRDFVEARRRFLLEHPMVKGAEGPTAAKAAAR